MPTSDVSTIPGTHSEASRSAWRGDAIVVGGGPAGASVACLLASWGHTVMLLTRPAAVPALGESLPPSLDKLLDRIGVRRAIETAGFLPSTGNTVRWGARAERAEHFPGGRSGFQIARDVFDRVLLDAAEAAGAIVRRRALVRDVHLEAGSTAADGSRTRVIFDDDGRAQQAEARWILDCTGRAGLLARTGMRRTEPGGRTLAIAGIWDHGPPWDIGDQSHTLVESYDGGWAWSVPVSATRRYVTVMVDPTLTAVSGGQGLAETYHAEIRRTSSLSRLTRGASLAGEPFARDASSYSAVRAGERGLLLVGDAASFVDPLSSYGVKKALASAWLAAVVTHSALTNAALTTPALELYETREREMYEGLRARLAVLAREAASAHPGSFWNERAEPESEVPDGEPDIAALRADTSVLRALDDLRQRESIALRETSALRRVNKAVIRENLVCLEPHLAVPAFPNGIRYIRGIDVATIVALAPSHNQVPDLFDAYNLHAPAAPLPDFLGALAVLIGKGMLAFA